MDIDTTLARHDRGRMPTHEYVILKDLLASMIDSDDEDGLDSTSGFDDLLRANDRPQTFEREAVQCIVNVNHASWGRHGRGGEGTTRAR